MIGNTFKAISGPLTDVVQVKKLMKAVSERRVFTCELIFYKKGQRRERERERESARTAQSPAPPGCDIHAQQPPPNATADADPALARTRTRTVLFIGLPINAAANHLRRG